MKKIISLILILIVNSAFSQCSLESIVPVKLGMTKFDARNSINATNQYHKEPYTEAFETPITTYPESLKGQSVKREVLRYISTQNNCFSSKKMLVRLVFLDDILYKIEFSSEFSELDYNNCFNQFKKIEKVLDNSFNKYKENWETTSSGEKVGESSVYILNTDSKKYHRFSIGINFKSNIYILSYEEVNLALTKINAKDGF